MLKSGLSLIFALALSHSLSHSASAQGQLTSSPISNPPFNLQSNPLMDFHFFEGGRGMHLSPGVLEFATSIRDGLGDGKLGQRMDRLLLKRWGIQEVNQRWVGIQSVDYGGLRMGVLGCVACHSGKAAGIHVIGIGNKNIDPGKIGEDGLRIELAHQKLTNQTQRKKTALQRQLEAQSIYLMQKLNNPKLKAETQGLVPVSLVGSWFYEQAGQPLPDHGFKGAVKVPSWFGFGEKQKVGQFADGIGLGHPPGWIVGVEITSGQTPETVRAYLSKIQTAVSFISDLQPPRYPGVMDQARAVRGQALFIQNCRGCHGEYSWSADGRAIYQEPKAIDWVRVQTDSDRLDYVTEDFLDRVRQSPLQDLIQLGPHAGKRRYIAPRLHGIWARFPYLHNGSVPTLADLLTPASARPKFFSLANAGEAERFDSVRVGLTQPKNDRERNLLEQGIRKQARWAYDTRKKGQSNQGHEKGTQLTPTQKLDLIEYLKTL